MPFSKEKGVRRYFIHEQLENMIKSGVYKVGDKLPTEAELARTYRVSRMTARAAVDSLVQDGLVYRVRGFGSFVARPLMSRSFSKLTSFTEDTLANGLHPSVKVISLTTKTAEEVSASELELAPADAVYVVTRLRLGDDLPLSVQRAVLPVALFHGLDAHDLSGSLYELFENFFSIRVSMCRQTVKPVLADRERAPLLNIAVGAPLLYIRRVTYDETGRPIEVVESHTRGDILNIVFDLKR